MNSKTSSPILISPMKEKDIKGVFKIFSSISSNESCLPYSKDLTIETFSSIWTNPKVFAYVATINDEITGAYFIKSQWPDRGSHVATAQYMVSQNHRGKGIGFLLGEHSIKTAKEKGFIAMQFNLVASTNKVALRLYSKLGFDVQGTLPKAYKHETEGLIDAYLMYRFL